MEVLRLLWWLLVCQRDLNVKAGQLNTLKYPTEGPAMPDVLCVWSLCSFVAIFVCFITGLHNYS